MDAQADPFDWNALAPTRARSDVGFRLHDETLRDGVQCPSALDPSIDAKIEMLHLLAMGFVVLASFTIGALFEAVGLPHITGYLLNGKLIIGHIFIYSFNYPVTIGPDLSEVITGISLGISISRQIQPDSRPSFAKRRLAQQPVYKLFIRIIRIIIRKILDFFHGGRQSGYIKTQPSD